MVVDRPARRSTNNRKGETRMNSHAENTKQSGDDVAAPDLTSFHLLPFHQPILDCSERDKTAEGTHHYNPAAAVMMIDIVSFFRGIPTRTTIPDCSAENAVSVGYGFGTWNGSDIGYLESRRPCDYAIVSYLHERLLTKRTALVLEPFVKARSGGSIYKCQLSRTRDSRASCTARRGRIPQRSGFCGGTIPSLLQWRHGKTEPFPEFRPVQSGMVFLNIPGTKRQEGQEIQREAS